MYGLLWLLVLEMRRKHVCGWHAEVLQVLRRRLLMLVWLLLLLAQNHLTLYLGRRNSQALLAVETDACAAEAASHAVVDPHTTGA